MSEKIDLLVVAEPTDYLAIEIVNLARTFGHNVVLAHPLDAAHLFSIVVHPENTIVWPEIPLFLRALGSSLIHENFDASFVASECVATLWAVATLNTSPCINRPTPYGFTGRVSPSAALTELRADTQPLIEIFSRTVPVLPQLGHQYWGIQEVCTLSTTMWPKIPEGIGPYRARPIDPESAYEIVVVVGSRAWRSTLVPLNHLELERASINITNQLGLTFCALTWSIMSTHSAGTLVRIDPFPTIEQVQFVWPAVSTALLETLLI